MPAEDQERGDATVSGVAWRRDVATVSHRVADALVYPEGPPSPAKRDASADADSGQPPTGSETAQNIIWIASYPKSGNTWVRAFLRNLVRELEETGSHAENINRLREYSNWEIGGRYFSEAMGKPIDPSEPFDAARVRPQVQRRLANSATKPFFVKTHLCYGIDQSYPTINLNATLAAIYIVRNPLDVAISYAHHSGRTFDETITGMAIDGFRTLGTEHYVHEVLGSWSQHVASWMGLAYRPVHMVRYEDMLASPSRIFGGIAEFLRLKPTALQLAAAIEKSSFKELRHQENRHGFVEKPQAAKQFFREGRAGQWRDVLSQEQIQSVITAHAPMMQRVGYLQPDSGATALGCG